jgi:hypothetical protein
VAFGRSVRVRGSRRHALAAAALAAATALGAAAALASFAEQKLVAPAPWLAAGMEFGASIAIDGNTLVVGSPSDDYAGSNEGSAWVFVRSSAGSAWTFAARLVADVPNPYADDERFGASVAVQGDLIVVGAPLYDLFGASSDEGVAFVFAKPPGGWSGTPTPVARLQASNPNPFHANEHVGISVALDGDVIAVGADSYELVRAASDEGAVFVYHRPVGGWSGTLTETARLSVSAPNPFDGAEGLGRSVAIEGDVIVAGADLYDFAGPNSNEGAAFVYLKPPGGWSGTQVEAARLQAAAANPVNPAVHLGQAIALSGDTVIVGAELYDLVGASSDEGVAFVYVRPPGGWSGTLSEAAQLRAATPNPHNSDEFFASAVAIDGDSVAVGARSYDLSAATSSEGALFLYAKPAAGWSGIQTEDTLITATDAALVDELGSSVALQGQDLVAGAHRADIGVLVDAGAAYAFILPGPNGYAVPGLHGRSALLAAGLLAVTALGLARRTSARAAETLATLPRGR